jgi:hypothetical protein
MKDAGSCSIRLNCLLRENIFAIFALAPRIRRVRFRPRRFALLKTGDLTRWLDRQPSRRLGPAKIANAIPWGTRLLGDGHRKSHRRKDFWFAELDPAEK